MKAALAAAIAVLTFLHYLIPRPAYPCTTFLISSGEELSFGKNYDWVIGYGLVITNKSGVLKKAFTADENPAIWTSKYGSITFNQFGREFPNGGMNETGLVVELMWLEDTVYPDDDGRESAGGILQWIQYQLDNHSSVEEVIESDRVLRIPQSSLPVHYLVADRDGNSASIEFLNGKMVYHTGSSMKFSVLANDTYEKSERYFEEMTDNRHILPDHYQRSSLNRFAKACGMIEEYDPSKHGNTVDYSFRILSSVSQGAYTRWSIVYDMKALKIFFRTSDAPEVKTINMNEFAHDCSVPVMFIDINFPYGGNVSSSMLAYNYRANRRLIESSYEGVDILRSTPRKERNLMAAYPGRLKCKKQFDE